MSMRTKTAYTAGALHLLANSNIALTPTRRTYSQRNGIFIERMSPTPGMQHTCGASAAESPPHRTTYSLLLRRHKHRHQWYQPCSAFPNNTNWPWLNIAHISCASPLPSLFRTPKPHKLQYLFARSGAQHMPHRPHYHFSNMSKHTEVTVETGEAVRHPSHNLRTLSLLYASSADTNRATAY